MMGVVAAGSDHDVLARDCILDSPQQLDLLLIAEARRLSGRACNHHAVGTVGHERGRQLLGACVIDRAVPFEWREHRCEQTSNLYCHLITPISMARSAI